jgi:hypothetical protein
VADLIYEPSSFATRQLEARDYTVDPSLTGSPVPIVVAPDYAIAVVEGWIYGPAGSYAMFATSVSVFQAASPYGFQPNAVAVPAGSRFKFHVNRGQSLVALASVSPTVAWGSGDTAVYASFHIWFEELQDRKGLDPVAGGGAVTRVRGPEVGWRKS